MPMGLKVKFLRSFKGQGELNHNTPSVHRLAKGCNSNNLGTVWRVKLENKIGFVVRDVEETKIKNLHPGATIFIKAITTVWWLPRWDRDDSRGSLLARR